MSNILSNLKNFTNIEIIILIIIIVVVAIIINSKIFKVILTSALLLVVFLTFYGKFPTFSGLVDKIRDNTKTAMKEDKKIEEVTINNKVYTNEFTWDKESFLPDENKYTILSTSLDLNNILVNDLISIKVNKKTFNYKVAKIEQSSSDYDTSYQLIISNDDLIVYANVSE